MNWENEWFEGRCHRGGGGGGGWGGGVKSFGKKSTASHRQSMGREGRIERSY